MTTKGCEHLEANTKRCNCTYEPCSRKGRCCLCIEYHRRMGQLPACYFSKDVEATYDRSIERFIASRKAR
jgi:hypothetical protein